MLNDPEYLVRLDTCRQCADRQSQTCQLDGQPCTVHAREGTCLRGKFSRVRGPQSLKVSIVITVGPGLRRYLTECLDSVATQEFEDVVVVFDNCPGHGLTAQTIAGRPILCVECCYGNVQLARRHGIKQALGNAILFLDVDNRLAPGCVAAMVKTLRDSPPRVAGVYPVLDYWNADLSQRVRTWVTPAWDRAAFERENYIDAGSLVWRHALEVSWTRTATHVRLEDHHMWSQLLRDGWEFRHSPGQLIYRVREDSMSRTEHGRDYSIRYSLDEEPITVFVALSGRTWAWPKLRDWLAGLPARCRLVLCDASGDRMFGSLVRNDLREDCIPRKDLRIYEHVVARSGIADDNRFDTEAAVQLAVCRLYNRMAAELSTALVWVIEDDTLPDMPPAEALEELLGGLDEQTVAISGVYPNRFTEDILAWSSGQGKDLRFVRPEQLGQVRYMPIAGAGFGCLLIRREALRSAPLAVTPEEPWYDPRFFRQLGDQGHRVKLACQVLCDHRTAPGWVRPTGGTAQGGQDDFDRLCLASVPPL